MTTKIFDELSYKYKSGNSVPIDRAWIKTEEFIEMRRAYDESVGQVQCLIEAIADAAFKAGIYNGEVPIDGPQALMLLNDLKSRGDE